MSERKGERRMNNESASRTEQKLREKKRRMQEGKGNATAHDESTMKTIGEARSLVTRV